MFGDASATAGQLQCAPLTAALKLLLSCAIVAATCATVATRAHAQSQDIPLQLIPITDSSGTIYRLGVNVGINTFVDGNITSGASRLYIFDTGSSSFNAAYGTPAWPSLPTSIATLNNYCYGDGSLCYAGNVVPVPSMSFYASSTATAPSYTLPALTPGYQITALTGQSTTGSGGPYQPLPNNQPISVLGSFYGIFGAGNFVSSGLTTPNIPVGGVLGQASLPGTTAGYVVAANGQQVSTVNGPQGAQTVTSCSPCVILGLTPSVLAQFTTKVPWHSTSSATFPNSGATSGTEWSSIFNFTFSPSQQVPSGPTLLDTGNPTIGNFLNTHGVPVQVGAGTTISISGAVPGAAVSNITTESSGSYTVSPVQLNVPPNQSVGIPFFLQNSVLLDLNGQVIGYTSNFVTDTPISVTPANPLIVSSASVPLGLAGVISGPGGVSITGGGSATLSAVNTYTGPTAVTVGGQLFLAGPGSIASSPLTVDGLFDISRTYSGALVPSLSGGGTVLLGSNILATASGTFGGVIADGGIGGGSGGSLAKIGAGTLTLTGASTYTGLTLVDAGTLAVNGSIISPVLVNSAAVLTGNGSVGSTLIAPGGALQPGYAGAGTLTVAGDLLLFPGSFYLPTTNSSTDVTGTALLGGTVMPLFQPGQVNKTWTILAAGNPLNTTFDALVLPSSLSGSLTYTTNAAILDLTSQMATVPGLTPNEMAVGGGLDNAFNGNGGLPAFGSLYALSPAGLAVALNQLSGQSLASEQTVLTNQALYGRETVLARLRQAGYATSTGPQAVLAYAGPDAISLDDATDAAEPLTYAGSKKSAAAAAFPLKAPPSPAYALSTGVTFWAQGMGGWGKINGNNNAAGTSGNFAGVLSGADVRLANNWLVGFALGYTGSSTNVSALASSAQVDTGLVAGYAGTNFGAWNLRLGGTYGINSIYTGRQIAFPGFMDHDTARFNAGTGQVFGEVGYGTAISSVAVEPFAGLAHVHLDTAGFTESGGISALSTSGASQDTGYSSLGVRAAAAYTLWNGMVLIPRASVAWQYAFGEINPATSLAFAGIPGSNFNVTGVPIARNAALIDAGADLRINPQAKIGLYYWGQQASAAHENGLRGTVTWMF